MRLPHVTTCRVITSLPAAMLQEQPPRITALVNQPVPAIGRQDDLPRVFRLDHHSEEL